jgi:GTP-binding protein
MQEGDPLENFRAINQELEHYNAELLRRPMLVVFTKLDITEVREQLPTMREVFAALGYRTMAVSAVTGEGTAELVRFVGQELSRLRAGEALDSPPPGA